MSEFREEVIAILTEADERLRQKIAEAAKAGDLSLVDVARSAAGHVRRTVELVKSGSHSLSGKPESGSFEKTRRADVPRRKGRKAKSSPYPKYIVRNSTLCRIGWSKKRKGEYVHKVDRRIFDRTASVMASISNLGPGPFMSDQIIDEVNRNAKAAVPSYQVYVVLGFLKTQKDIQQVGRKGYRVPADLSHRAKASWKRLAETLE